MKSVLIFIKITLFLQTKGHFFTQNNDPWLFSALNNEEGVIILRLKMTPVISLRVSRCQAQMITVMIIYMETVDGVVSV